MRAQCERSRKVSIDDVVIRVKGDKAHLVAPGVGHRERTRNGYWRQQALGAHLRSARAGEIELRKLVPARIRTSRSLQGLVGIGGVERERARRGNAVRAAPARVGDQIAGQRMAERSQAHLHGRVGSGPVEIHAAVDVEVATGHFLAIGQIEVTVADATPHGLGEGSRPVVVGARVATQIIATKTYWELVGTPQLELTPIS